MRDVSLSGGSHTFLFLLLREGEFLGDDAREDAVVAGGRGAVGAVVVEKALNGGYEIAVELVCGDDGAAAGVVHGVGELGLVVVKERVVNDDDEGAGCLDDLEHGAGAGVGDDDMRLTEKGA